MLKLLNRYIMFGRCICEKYQSRDEKFPEPIDIIMYINDVVGFFFYYYEEILNIEFPGSSYFLILQNIIEK